jgi:hypothetical protein
MLQVVYAGMLAASETFKSQAPVFDTVDTGRRRSPSVFMGTE